MTTSLGAKIKKHRDEKGYSLDKLAEISGTSKSYIWELENRDLRKPTAEKLRPSAEKLTKIAQALSVTTDYLLDESAQPSDKILEEAFFREFKRLDASDQEKIKQMVEVWGKKEQ